MHLIKKKTIEIYCSKYADAKDKLLCWSKDIKEATWKMPNDIKKEDATVSFIGDSRVVFNIKKYRLIADINYERGWVFVIRFLTHDEYDKIDVATISAEY